MINIALARTALEEHRNRQQLLPFLDGAQQARRGNFADVPLAVEILVMTLAGRNEIRVDVQLIAFDADLAVDHRLAAGMIRETEGDFVFVCHSQIPSIAIEKVWFQSFQSFHRSNRFPERVGTA